MLGFDDVMLCFDDIVLCFDDVVLCFVRRRALLRSSTYFVLFARDLAGLLCDARRRALLRHAKYAASDEVSQFPCFLFVFAFAPSLSLGGGPCLSMPFLVPFSQGDHRRTQQDRDSDCVHSMCLLLLAFSGGASPATEKFCALRAALCSPRYK